MWPQYNKQSYPKFCKKVDFSITKLNPIINELNNSWYSKDGENKNDDFWKHEYEKHGSCMFKDLDELDYFKTTLSLFNEAIEKNIIKKFDNDSNNSNKILIPVDLDFKFIIN